jgi:hypothetical protein
LRVRQDLRELLRKARRSKKIHTPLHIRRRVRKWRDSVVSAASNTEEIIFNLTTNVNHAIIKPMYEPRDNHGSKAEIGDLVKVYTDTGMETGVMGIIAEVKHYYSWSMEHWRKIRLHGKVDFIDDHTIRIVSKADVHGRDRKDKKTD